MTNKLCKNKISALASYFRGVTDERAKIAHLQKLLSSKRENLVELSLEFLGQEPLLSSLDLEPYLRIERFYAPLGGLIGYHAAFLEKLSPLKTFEIGKVRRPEGPDLRQESFTKEGIEALSSLGEIYPVGGLGSRLDFRDEKGALLPVALLPFGGRSLVEGLVRDVLAREHLYERFLGKKTQIPLALMTSEENQEQLLRHFEERNWFGRPQESFFLFPQLMVPVITKEGRWTERREPNGHGALWLTAEKAGVFDWFEKQGKEHLLVRQINNPIAGVDEGLLSFVGYGVRHKKIFGFASCERKEGAAEGVLVLHEERRIVNIEYTEGISRDLSYEFPANTNILYAHIPRLRKVIEKHPFQGQMVNMKGKEESRLESMMQSISDVLDAKDVYVTYNERHKTISPTKRKFEGQLLETPEAAFFDQQKNSYELLSLCGSTLPPFRDIATFVEKGPSPLFTYTPLLGPLYSLIQKKIRNCSFAEEAELSIELVDLTMEGCFVEGSLLIEGKGRCHLKNVRVKNLGRKSVHYSGQVERFEKAVLRVEGELFLEDLTLEGEHFIEVPAGKILRSPLQ